MPPKCTVCNSKNRTSIESDIRTGESLRNIAKQYQFRSHLPIHRHATKCLKLDFGTLQQQIKKGAAINHHEILAKNYALTEELRTAAENWLRLDTGEISLEPRSDEIMVVVTEFAAGIPMNRRVPLQTLLDEIRGVKKPLVEVVVRDDNRSLVLKYIQECRAHVDAFMKLQQLEGDTPEAIAMRMLYIAFEMAKRFDNVDVDTALRMISEQYVIQKKAEE